MKTSLFPSSIRPSAGARLRRLQRALWLTAALLALACPRARVQAQTVTKTVTTTKSSATSTTTSTFVTEEKVVDGKTVKTRVPVTCEMPLMVRGDSPYVQVEVNGKVAVFLIDTGANVNAITPKAAARLGLQVETQTNTIRGVGGSVNAVENAPINSLKVGEFVYQDQEAFIHDLPDGLQCDGMLGTPFIGLQVLTLDYQNKRLKLTRNQDFVPDKEDKALPLELSESERPLVRLDLGGKRELFLLDTGNGGSIDLYAEFVQRNKLTEVYAPILTMTRGRGIGGLIKGSYARFPKVKIAEYELKGVVGTLAPPKGGITSWDKSKAQGDIAGNVGGEIWERFTLTLDYKNERAFVRPNSLLNDQFDAPRFGAATFDDGKVIDVAPNSPAQEAGIVVGDTIVAIEGKTLAEIAALPDLPTPKTGEAKAKGKKTIRIKLRGADGKEREVTVTLRDLI